MTDIEKQIFENNKIAVLEAIYKLMLEKETMTNEVKLLKIEISDLKGQKESYEKQIIKYTEAENNLVKSVDDRNELIQQLNTQEDGLRTEIHALKTHRNNLDAYLKDKVGINFIKDLRKDQDLLKKVLLQLQDDFLRSDILFKVEVDDDLDPMEILNKEFGQDDFAPYVRLFNNLRHLIPAYSDYLQNNGSTKELDTFQNSNALTDEEKTVFAKSFIVWKNKGIPFFIHDLRKKRRG